jgi:hypothetical protein
MDTRKRDERYYSVKITRSLPLAEQLRIGIIMLPVLLVTWLSGTRLDRRRDQSNILPVVHLVNNVLLLILAASRRLQVSASCKAHS